MKTGRDALYVQERGIFDLPIADVGMALFALPTAFGMLWLVRVAGARRARVIAILGGAALLLVFWRIGGRRERGRRVDHPGPPCASLR